MDVSPEDVIVTVDCFDDIVVKAVQLLQQSQLLPNLQQLGMLGNRESKQLLSTSVRYVLSEQVVKSVLKKEKNGTILYVFKPLH